MKRKNTQWCCAIFRAGVSPHFLHFSVDGGRGGWQFFRSSEERAKRMLAEELKRLGWGPGEWRRRRKGDPQKVNRARRLQAETTMSLAWMAERLSMDSWSHGSNLSRKNKRCKK